MITQMNNIELPIPEYSMRGTNDRALDAFFAKLGHGHYSSLPEDAKPQYRKAMFAAWMSMRDEAVEHG
jgi:hypothetical protein